MPSLVIPGSGLSLGNSHHSAKHAVPVPNLYGLSISDDVIDQMIRCVQSGKEIQLSLGQHPSLQYGNKSQPLYTSHDPFQHELYHTTNNTFESATMSSSSQKSSQPNPKRGIVKVENKPNAAFLGLFMPKKFIARNSTPIANASRITATAVKPATSPVTTNTDAALETLKRSLASESQKKAENTINYVKDGSGLPGIGGKRGAQGKSSTKSRLMAQNPPRSMPASPALSGVGSPTLDPKSVPLSQQIAQQAKANRKPVVHLLAIEDMTEKDLQEIILDVSANDINQALQKVAELKGDKWSLIPKFYKELDVWTYDYESNDDRQRAIDNAVKIYDRLRLSRPEAEWLRLLPKHERGTGKHLSKVQAAIAASESGHIKTPKIHVQKVAEDSGKDTSMDDSEAPRASPPPPVAKPKKTSEKDAQVKRLMSGKPSKANTPKVAAVKKEKAKEKPKEKTKVEKPKAGKPQSRVLSSQYVNSDSEDDESITSAPAPIQKVVPKQQLKRSREDEIETSDSSVPLSKKVKKEISSQASSQRTSSQVSQSSYQYTKPKGTSPQKSSPLASSPPTNASEVETPSHRTTSTSSSPRKISRSPIHKRQKSSSVASSVTSTSSQRSLRPEVVDKARKYRLYYPKYEALHREVAALGRRDLNMETKLIDMHERLSLMKQEILQGIIEN